MESKRVHYGYFLCIFFIIALFVLNVSAYYDSSGSTIINSDVITCSSGSMHILDSNVENSRIECANVTESAIYESRIVNPSRELEYAEIEYAVIIGNLLQSGKFVYNGWTYYGPVSLDKIYQGVPPSPQGSVGANVQAVKDGSSFFVTYSSGILGYTVTVDASNLGGSPSIPLHDNGAGNDLNANDGIYTSGDIVVDYQSTGDRILLFTINDNFGNEWSLDLELFVDNEDPTGSIETEPSNLTNSRLIELNLEWDDNNQVYGCRIGNSLNELNSALFDTCRSSVDWMLSPQQGNKTIYFEVKDLAGNIYQTSDWIELELPSLMIPPFIELPVDYWWGFDDRVNFRIYYDDFVDTSGMTYDYRIYNSSACLTQDDYESDVCNVTSWEYSLSNLVSVYNLSLELNTNYTIGARAYADSISEQGISDKFALDLIPPEILEISSSLGNSSWISSSIVSFDLYGFDDISGVRGYSYRLSESGLEPNSVIDAFGENATIFFAGLSSGNYNLTVKAQNNANLFSDVVSYQFQVDTSRPAPPVIQEHALSGRGNLVINWTPVSSYSGIAGYEVLISTDPFFENIVFSNFTTNTHFNFSSDVLRTYYFKVRALNNAGVYSFYSNQKSLHFDVFPPKFRNVRPNGIISHTRPVIHVETSKVSKCYYGEDQYDVLKFSHTGGNLHEHRLDIFEGSHTYVIICHDEHGNENSSVISFEIDTDRFPTSLSTDESSIELFTSEIYDINFSVHSSNIGLGGLRPHEFSIYLNGNNYDEFSINDYSSGSYVLSIETPSRTGNYELEICHENVCSNPILLDVLDLKLSISVEFNESHVLNEFSHTHFLSHDNYTLILAFDGADYFFESSEVNNEVKGHSLINSDTMNYIGLIGSSVTSNMIERKNTRINTGMFRRDINPSFSGIVSDEINLKISFVHPNIVFDGNSHSMRGDRNILIKNSGITSNRKINLEMDIS